MEYTKKALTITTNHPASHYGIPVVLMDGEEVSATQSQHENVVNLFGPCTYGDLLRDTLPTLPADVREGVTRWLAQWGM